MYKIVVASVKKFKRIEDVTITPGADSSIILLGGKNRQGKSSFLDALNAATRGKRAHPVDPVRHGSDEAEIDIELVDASNGAEPLTIRCVIQPDGESDLEVRDSLGAVKAPQDLLNRILGSRFLDPLQFIQQPAKEQRLQLMKLIPEAERISELNAKRERVFAKRTEIGRDLEKATGELGRLGVIAPPGKPTDVAELVAESKQIADLQREVDKLHQAHQQCRRETNGAADRLRTIEAGIERLKAELAKLETERTAWTADVAKCKEVEAESTAKVDAAEEKILASDVRRVEIDKLIAAAGDTNRKIVEAEAQIKRRAETESTVQKLTAEREELTKVLATIDDRKVSILSSAKLPVEGLSVDDEGVTLAGVPFAQASGAEKLRVALTLAIAASPGLADVWIRDGALLDEESLAMVQEHAKTSGHRVWIERVGTRDDGVIVIADGKVAAS